MIEKSMKRLTSLVANGQHPDNGKEALWYLLGQCEDELKKVAKMAEDEGFSTTAQALYGIVDDIDTCDDIFKGDHDGYREAVRRKVKEICQHGSSDGYTVELLSNAQQNKKKA